MMILMLALALVVTPPTAPRPGDDPEELLREARLSLLDRDWVAVRHHCERLLVKFPRSPQRTQARFYLARAYEGAGQPRQALSAYQTFLRLYSDPGEPGELSETSEYDELREDAQTAALGLARKLLDRGEEEYWPLLREGLVDRSRSVRVYAALQVSYLADRKRAREAVSVLSEVVRTELIPDVQDRARIALLRLDPRALVRVEESLHGEPERRPRAPSAPGRWLKLRIYRGGRGEPEVRLAVPLALGELVYRALSEDLKRELRREKGIDLDNFWTELLKLGPGRILSIESENQRFELWIE